MISDRIEFYDDFRWWIKITFILDLNGVMDERMHFQTPSTLDFEIAKVVSA